MRSNIDPRAWGQPAWAFLFAIADSFPKTANRTEQDEMTLFMLSLGPNLPCAKCRKNYETFVQHYPPHYIKGRQELVNWFSMLKNKI